MQPVDGMSLRDYFAAKAMNGFMACGSLRDMFAVNCGISAQSALEQLSSGCYALADAMLAERKK